MDSTEILRQYFSGAFNSSTSITELGKLIGYSTPKALHESAKARYAIGFINRVRQFKNGQASERDLCMNLRDLILTHGTLRVNDMVFHVAKNLRHEFGLVCEGENQVSCLASFPEWLEPRSFIEDVYRLEYSSSTEYDTFSAGDSLLRERTVFIDYKSYEQKIAIHTALNLPDGYTLLISQPTGGGKSLSTQMIAASSKGLTVVIVPTVALALDQYHSAKSVLRSNRNVFCYRGDQSNTERLSIISAIQNQTAQVLFTSPEALLRNTELFQLLSEAAEHQYLDNIVIDEAHVVPDWGVFFRPDFQLFSIALKKWRRISNEHLRVFLLSATLSNEVVNSLMSLFGNEGKNVQLRCDSLRHEPRFYFYPAKGKQEQSRRIVEAVEKLPKPMVIYTLRPVEAMDLQKKLRDCGFKNIPCFTGETKDRDRDEILKGWKENQYDIVIATSAFGIGVDKPDVRTIVHVCAPESLSRFYQEVGRAGRDRLPSLSLLIPYTGQVDGRGDLRKALELVNKRVLTVPTMIVRWTSMFRDQSAIIEADRCIMNTSVAPSSMNEQEAEYTGNLNIKWNVNLLLFLHRAGFLSLEDVYFEPTSGSYRVTCKMLQPELLGKPEELASALEEPRANEYAELMEGYNAIKGLISSPKARCWGRAFRQLFPLSDEVCNGCPHDPEGRVTIEKTYKVREKVELILSPAEKNLHLKRLMGSYDILHIHAPNLTPYSEEIINLLCEKVAGCGIGTIVVPLEIAKKANYPGLVLSYEEFPYTVIHQPFLFNQGVLCVLPENNPELGNTLYGYMRKLDAYGYTKVFYCGDQFRLFPSGKALQESIDGYSIRLEKL